MPRHATLISIGASVRHQRGSGARRGGTVSRTYDVQDLVTALAQRLVDELAGGDVRRLADVLQLLPPEAPNAFRQEGQFWTVQYAGRLVRLRDARGLHHLARLLAQPGDPIHVLALVGDSGARGSGLRDDGDALHVSGDEGDAVIDAQARSSYRERLRELEEDLAEAQRCDDEGRVWRLSAERDCRWPSSAARWGSAAATAG